MQVADIWWHRTPATMVWYYLTLEKATSRSSANRHPILSSTHTSWRVRQVMDGWQTLAHTHTQKETNAHTHTQYKVLPSQRTLSKMLSAKWPQGSNLGELHRYESVNAANTPKLTRSRYRYKEHPKGKRKPQPAVWIRLIVDCASLCQVRTDTAWHYFFPEMHATSSVR